MFDPMNELRSTKELLRVCDSPSHTLITRVCTWHAKEHLGHAVANSKTRWPCMLTLVELQTQHDAD